MPENQPVPSRAKRVRLAVLVAAATTIVLELVELPESVERLLEQLLLAL